MSYGKLKERKLNQKDYEFSCEKTRQQLSEYMNEQAKRVNIDSAKKRAVLQHMDYEGFRQMVLGANIFPTKTRELQMFTKGEEQTILGQQQIENEEGQQKKEKKDAKLTRVEMSVQGKSEKHCTSFREFKKKFLGDYTKEGNLKNTLECYNLIKEQNQERLSKIFNSQCEANILLKITDIYARVVKQMLAKETQGLQNQCTFMLLFYQYVLSIPTMKSLSLLILTKKQKQAIGEFILSLTEHLNQSAEQIEKISQMILSK